MRIRRNLLLIFLLIGLTGLGTMLTDSSEGQGSGICQWTDALATLLGIEAVPPPEEDQQIQIVNAVVKEAEKIGTAGLYGSREGDKIKLICISKDRWRIKNYRTGMASTITVAPHPQ